MTATVAARSAPIKEGYDIVYNNNTYYIITCTYIIHKDRIGCLRDPGVPGPKRSLISKGPGRVFEVRWGRLRGVKATGSVASGGGCV